MNDEVEGHSSRRVRVRLAQVTNWESLVVEGRYSARGLATVCGFSVRHLERHISKRYGKRLGEFISGIRMQKAYNLLRSGFSIKETAIGLGFKQISHFCRCFKHHFEATASTVLQDAGLLSQNGSATDQQMQLGLFQPPNRRNRGTSRPERRKRET